MSLKKTGKLRVAEVRVSEDPAQSATLEVALAGGQRVVMRLGFDKELLSGSN